MPSDKAQFLAALAEAGFPVSSVAAIRDQYDPLPSGVAVLLLEWIPRLEDRRLQESVAWALLAARSGTLDGAALAESVGPFWLEQSNRQHIQSLRNWNL